MRMHEIETARLKLRQFVPDDLDDLYRLYSDAEIMRFLGGVRTKKSTEAELFAIAETWKQHHFGMWAVVHKMDNKMIGRCGLNFLEKTPEVQLGYAIDKLYWGKGLTTEASLAALKYGFEEIKRDRIVAIARPDNVASQRVIQKVGMKYEKNAHYYNADVAYYALSRADYQPANFPYILREVKD